MLVNICISLVLPKSGYLKKEFWFHYKWKSNNFISFHFILFILILLFKYSFLPFPPPQPNPQPFPPPSHFHPSVIVHTSFIIVPTNPSAFSPEIPSPLPSGHCQPVLNFSVWLYFACLFVLLIRFLLKVRSYGISFSLPGLFCLA